MTTALTASITAAARMIDGVRIRYAESLASQHPVVLLTSPWPESLYAFAPMWATLAEHTSRGGGSCSLGRIRSAAPRRRTLELA